MSNDDFPIPVKVRMWAFLNSGQSMTMTDRLENAEYITQFLWSDFYEEDMIGKEDIN